MKHTKKLAPPDTLFERFLQRQAKSPTHIQLHTWENDGGHTKHSHESFAIIDGNVCYSVPQKMKAYLGKYWRLVKSQLTGKSLSRQPLNN